MLLSKFALSFFGTQSETVRKVFFFEFGNAKVTVHRGAETIQGRKLYEEIRYLLVVGDIRETLM